MLSLATDMTERHSDLNGSIGELCLYWGRGLATLLLFLDVMDEVGRKWVWVIPWPLCSRIQYDYKQTGVIYTLRAG